MTTISIQKMASMLSKGALTKINPATMAASTTLGAGKQLSKEIFGYDFVGLLIKLFIFYAVAFVFAKFMEAVIFTRGAFTIIAGTLGFKIPTSEQLPQSLKDLFGEQGVKGLKFWDIVKIISILLVTAEFFQYLNNQKNSGGESSPMTIGIFTLIIISLGITTVPELVKRFKGMDFNLEELK